MNFETVKSIILTILIALSATLTWNIWTAHPSYEKLDTKGYIPVKSDTKDVSDIIKLNGVRFHSEGRHFQLTDKEGLNSIQTKLASWNVSDLEEIGEKTKTDKEFASFLKDHANTEILLMDEVPFKLFKTMMDMDNDDMTTFSFDRIIFHAGTPEGKTASVYFVSTKNKLIYQGKVTAAQVEDFYDTFYKKASTYPEYQAYKVNSKSIVYYPKERVKMSKLTYRIQYLNMSNFKAALFKDPTIVRTQALDDGTEYTDGLRLMTVKNGSMISYVDPAQKSKVLYSASDLLEQGIAFINNHAGWGKYSYQFAGLNESDQRIIFRLFVKGVPVFNEAGMSRIEQIWGNEEIYSYKRPSFSLDFELHPEETNVELPSAESALDVLKSKKSAQIQALQDLIPGYRLSKESPESKFVTLVPAWYYRANDTWALVPFEEPGGA